MDDLTRIKGIGPKTAEELRARGVTSFAQIAGFASTEVPVEVADLLPASRMDDWGPQAALYAAETPQKPPAPADPNEAGKEPAPTAPPSSPPQGGGAQKPTQTRHTVIRITAKRDGFRRAGVRHSKTPVDHPVGWFSKEQLDALQAEPNLVVELVTVDTAIKQAGGAA